MNNEMITIDVERLRKDLENEAMGAFFGGGFGGALVEAGDVKNASPDELIDMAARWGKDLSDYIV